MEFVVYPDLNLSDAQVGVGCLVLGAVTMVNWWFAMFSDHWYGDLGRSFGEGEFNVGRNTVAPYPAFRGSAVLVCWRGCTF